MLREDIESNSNPRSALVARPKGSFPEIPVAEIPAIVWQADAATLTFRSVVGSAEQLTGYPAAHWIETPEFFSERIHPDDRAATLASYQTAIAQGGDASAEYRGLSTTGVVWLRETIRVIHPTITGVIIAIGRRRQLEEQLLRAERTGALRGLTTRVAHDLHNPLTIVTGYGEEVLNTLDSQDPLRGDMEQILAAADRITDLACRLLRFTQPQANPPGVINLPRAIARLERRIAHAAGQGVAVEVRATRPILAFADESQFEEVMLALISGAREEAWERTKVTIECDLDTITEQLPGATLTPGRYARLSIRDDARGTHREQRGRMFESFLAADDSEWSGGPALARAYAVVREWGGDIAFSSEPFGGSSFLVYLPHCPEFEL
jgi:signal transduction histidine kinase